MNLIRRLFCPVVFVVFGYWLLLSTLQPYLLETAALTPFYTTTTFLTYMLSRPAGGLFALSSGLQSCLAVPWLGATLLLAVLTALAWATRRAFRCEGWLTAVCFLPAFLVLLNYTDAGYMVYLIKMPALAFTPAVGLLAATLLAWAYRRLSAGSSRASEVGTLLLILLTASAGYWLLGVYALVASLLFVILTLADLRHNRRLAVGRIALCVITAAALPYLFYHLGLIHLRRQELLFVGLPDYLSTETEAPLRRPLWLAFGIMAVLALVEGIRPEGRKTEDRSSEVQKTDNTSQRKKVVKPTAQSSKLKVQSNSGSKFKAQSIIAVVLMSAAMWGTYHYTFRDHNFLTILEMKQAFEQGDNDLVLQLATQSDEPPTRLQVAMTLLALWRTGRAGNELFRYPDGDAPYNSPRPFQYQRLMAGRLLYYYLGKVNYAYRWCMEDMVEYGHRPDYLKYMARCAMLNGETELAQRYITELSHAPFCGDFASHYQQLLTAHADDADMKAIRPLMQYTDLLDGDGGMIELYLLNCYAYSTGGSRPMVELSLLCGLITKNLNGFWPRFMALLPTWHGHIPTHYQEAALMVKQLAGGPDLSRLPISADVKARFQQLVEASASNGDNQQNASLLRPQFGDTFWYYYFFVQGLKTN